MSAPYAWLVIAATLAAVLAMLRVWRHAARLRLPLLAVQPLLAATLAAALLLPHAPGPSQIHVLTDGADASALPSGAAAVRLPGAAKAAEVTAWPDLATLLRAHPRVTSVVVHGHGLGEDDLAALGARRLAYQPGPAPHGIVALDAPLQVRAGARFPIQGRVRATGEAVLRLLDPAGGVHAEARPQTDGRFVLDAVAPAQGRHAFTLALLVDGDLFQTLPIAVAAGTPDAQQGVLLAAAPSAELRALRRWAADAGMELDARITLAPGLPLQDAAVRLDAATLADADLLILDERSWPTGTAERTALRVAVEGGLGVLLRITGPPPRTLADELARLSGPANSDAAVASASLLVPDDVGDAPEPVLWRPRYADASTPLAGAQTSDTVELHAWPVTFAADAAPLLTANDGRLLAAWRPVGKGRIGVLAVADTHRLQARLGRTDYATLWSHLWSQLARSAAGEAVTVSPPPIQDLRTAVCGGAGDIVITSPEGADRHLLRDAGARNCAAWYPQSAGWHQVRTSAGSHHIHVADASQLAPLLQETRRSTTTARAGVGTPDDPGTERWPWRPLLLAAWLLLLALSWLLERRAQPGHDTGPVRERQGQRPPQP